MTFAEYIENNKDLYDMGNEEKPLELPINPYYGKDGNVTSNKLPTTFTDGRMDRYNKIKQQVLVLQQLHDEFGGKTLDNVLQNLLADLKELEKDMPNLDECIDNFTKAHKNDWEDIRVVDCFFGKNLTQRILSACKFELHISTLGELVKTPKTDLLKCYQIGHKCIVAIREFFKEKYNVDW